VEVIEYTKIRTEIRVTVPIHSGKIIHPKILNKISEDTGIPPDELRR
jgi:predicted RNA binding protein YcfA (HicA-like mRNA interferase family)